MNNTSDQQSRYAQQIGQELHTFNSPTKFHELPPIAYYWSQKFLAPLLREHGFQEAHEFFAKYLRQAAERVGGPPVFASLGTGDCHIEVQTARLLKQHGLAEFTIECRELNTQLLENGREQAKKAGVEAHMAFVETDFNSWTADKRYTAILACHSLHHVVELEHLFDEVRRALDPAGFFIVTDMIGRNGHMRWPEALAELRPFWYEMPLEYRWHCLMLRLEEEHINHDCSTHGFEGIRAQDILPLLIERFDFRFFLAFSNLMDLFVDRGFGHNFESDGEWDRDFIDRVQAYDEQAILSGRLTPTHMYTVMTPGPSDEHFYSRGLTPERSARREPQAARAERLEVATRALKPTEDKGLGYQMKMEVSGGRGPYTWSATDLPPGLCLSNEGRLEGSVDADGVFTPVITVIDSSKPPNAAAQRFTIMVKPKQVTMPLAVVSPGTLPHAWVGEEYAEALLGSGGEPPLQWTIESGTLPRGLVLGAQSGEIRGTATGSSRECFGVKVTDAAGHSLISQHEITATTSAENTIARVGVLAHVAAGPAWSCAIRLSNPAATPVETALRFYASSGRRKNWTLGGQVKSGLEPGQFRLAPHATVRMELTAGSGEEISGWVEILATGPVGAHAELVYSASGGGRSEVTIPMERSKRQNLRLGFDNSAGNRTAMAVLNVPEPEAPEPQPGPAAHLGIPVVVVRDETGQWIETRQLPLRPGRHKAFMLADEIPSTAGRRGTIEIQAAFEGAVGGVSLRVSGHDTFVMLPPV